MMYLGDKAVGLATNIVANGVGHGNINAIIGYGNEYIVTDIYPTSSELINFDFKVESLARYKHFIGACVNNSNIIKFQSDAGGTGVNMVSWSGDQKFISTKDIVSKRAIYSFYGPSLIIDSTNIDAIYSAIKPLTIFAGYYNQNLESNLYGLGTFYGTRIIDLRNQIIIHDLVPWFEDSKACVKDLITGEIYYNAGTGAFGYIDLEGNVHNI